MWPAPYSRKEIYDTSVACTERGRKLFKRMSDGGLKASNLNNIKENGRSKSVERPMFDGEKYIRSSSEKRKKIIY